MYRLGILLLVPFYLAIGGCSMTRAVATPYAAIVLMAGTDVNPDAEGRASPLIVRTYELSARAAFDTLDFDRVWGNAAVVLSDQLLSSQEHVLLPGETKAHRIDLQPNAEYVAVVAAYRHIDQARWKLIYRVSPDWFQRHHVVFSSDAVALQSKRASKSTE